MKVKLKRCVTKQDLWMEGIEYSCDFLLNAKSLDVCGEGDEDYKVVVRPDHRLWICKSYFVVIEG